MESFNRYRDVLSASFGVSASAIDNLKASSDDLNALLHAYAAARETSEEAAFLYYKEHYSEISHLFNSLYDGMREVMTGKIFKFMCGKMELEYEGDTEMQAYKKWRMKNIVAHVYLICQVLDIVQYRLEVIVFRIIIPKFKIPQFIPHIH